MRELARERVSAFGTWLINNVSKDRLDLGGWPHGDRGLSHRWPSWQHDSSLLEKKCGTDFLEQSDSEEQTGHGRVQKSEESSHQKRAAPSWDERG